MSAFELRAKTLDGERRFELRCPGCGTWGLLDDDQLRGHVSAVCPNECGWHETHDFLPFLPEGA